MSTGQSAAPVRRNDGATHPFPRPGPRATQRPAPCSGIMIHGVPNAVTKILANNNPTTKETASMLPLDSTLGKWMRVTRSSVRIPATFPARDEPGAMALKTPPKHGNIPPYVAPWQMTLVSKKRNSYAPPQSNVCYESEPLTKPFSSEQECVSKQRARCV